MARKSLDELGSLQRMVLEILWARGEATVHQVRDALPGEPEAAYTTVLSVLQKLEKAGWVRHRRDGRMHVFRAHESRDQAGSGALRRFVDRVFRGEPTLLFQHLLDDERLADDDLAELRDMIDRRRQERRDDP